ncbi:MAG: hypothetical protein IT378_11845 [Sandaracinaceae bacterium]|nr:hypothetical protein [Sandaracinaceae bacterium]
MSELTPCTSCARHVRVTQESCPFCGAAIEVAPRPARQVVARAARLAILSGAVALGACGGSQQMTDAGHDAGSDGGSVVVDAGTAAGTDAGTDTDAGEIDAAILPPYGTPSPPDFVV